MVQVTPGAEFLAEQNAKTIRDDANDASILLGLRPYYV
jgi:hypothetical protein